MVLDLEPLREELRRLGFDGEAWWLKHWTHLIRLQNILRDLLYTLERKPLLDRGSRPVPPKRDVPRSPEDVRSLLANIQAALDSIGCPHGTQWSTGDMERAEAAVRAHAEKQP